MVIVIAFFTAADAGFVEIPEGKIIRAYPHPKEGRKPSAPLHSRAGKLLMHHDIPRNM